MTPHVQMVPNPPMGKDAPLPPCVKKPRTIRELGEVDIAKLKAMVARLSETAWDREDSLKENDFEVFHHTRHIILRFIEGNRNPAVHYSNPGWAAWSGLLQPVMEQAIAPYYFRKPVFAKAMFARLAAGASIDMHVDGAGSNPRCHKIHVPLITNPDAMFMVADEQAHLAEGRAYEVNNVARHGVVNGGTGDRIHFIFEVYEGDFEEAAA